MNLFHKLTATSALTLCLLTSGFATEPFICEQPGQVRALLNTNTNNAQVYCDMSILYTLENVHFTGSGWSELSSEQHFCNDGNSPNCEIQHTPN